MIRPSYANVMSTIAVVGALAGGSAYAADTIGSSDIIDGQVKSADVGDGEIGSADVKDNSINTFDVHSFLGADVVDGSLTGDDIGDGTLTGSDIKDGWVGQVDLANTAVNSAKTADDSLTNADIQDFTLVNANLLTGSVDTRVATDNSLTGADVIESTLDLAPVSTARFESTNTGASYPDGYTQVMVESGLPDGSWAVTATVNSSAQFTNPDHEAITDMTCVLRNGNGDYLGGATDRRRVPSGDIGKRSLSMTGGVQIGGPPGFPYPTTVGVYCTSQEVERIDYGSMMLIRVGGFS